MMKKSKIKSIIRRASALFICLSMLLLSACTKNTGAGIKTIKSVESRNIISLPAQDASIHYSENAEAFTQTVASSGLIKLCVDPATNSFCIIETTKNKLWSALPLLSNLAQGEELVSNASIVEITVNGGTDVYILNSQDNSLAYSTASYSATENGARFIYDIFTDKDTAAKKTYDKNDIGFRLTVTVALADGSMTVGCTHENLTGNEDAFIEKIDILNGFGSFNDSGNDDFLLVPDGSGAIIKTAIYDESFEPLSFAVYGNDPSTQYTASGSAIVPAFGIKHGDSAFVALIRKGDAAAFINADKATTISEYNKVYAAFTVTPAAYDDETIYISKASATSEISLCYRFLSGKNATYSGLASACREQLIRNSVLSSINVEAGEYLPFFLTLTGASRSGVFGNLKKLTTFEQAQDMLIRMKNKGINNVSIRYKGVFSGGVDSKDISKSSVLSRLGGTSGLNSLFEYVTAQKMSLYLDINLLSASDGFGSDNAVDILKNDTVFNPSDLLGEYMDNESKQRTLRSISSLPDVVSSVLKKSNNYGFSGFCINDAGSLLYSDFSSDGMLRQTAADRITSSISPLSTSYSSMTSTGNFYMLKNINSVINIPLKATVPESGAYVSVPFVQLILHGIVDYAGEAVNTSTNQQELLLKCIEYGACPHYEWNYESITDDTENDIFFYDNTINPAAEFYTRANEILNDLRDARMTDHYEVEDGIFCTEYDTGSMIYVNYTDSDYTVLGAVVEARSFIRIN